ncbi:30S ribosomal protein S2 [Phanerochaete sordida]|uniref:30S ribosomal protein S2 n=1 Tax=Phanerochaete sordida TaxID=48140 RepID=A0A9P3L957_9APHY|nr:30S ribosomal protein S2 [Phanerochaete sordida]
MSSQLARPSFAAAARCARRPPRSLAGVGAVRSYLKSTGEEPLLQTEYDWVNMQANRQSFRTLVETFGSHGSTQTRENTFQPHHPLHRPTAPSQSTLSALLAAGAHLGHSKSLMNPNFVPYAYGERAGITIIDLDHTLPLLRRAAKVVRSVTAKNGMVVFVGTRPDLRVVVRKAAERLGNNGYHVGERWLPGTLTNSIELFGVEERRTKRLVPDLVVLLNPISNFNAIRECAMQNVPTIGIVDSNVDPRLVMYPIPANDESTRTAELVAGVLSVAGREGVALGEAEALKLRQADIAQKRATLSRRETKVQS